MEKEKEKISLCEDIAEQIVELSRSDRHTVATLSRVSRGCVHPVRKKLYRELDLVNGEYEGTASPVARLRPSAREARRNSMATHPYLLQHVRAIAFSTRSQLDSYAERTLTSLYPSLDLSTQYIQHIHIQFGRVRGGTSHFKVHDSFRNILEPLLRSSNLESFEIMVWTLANGNSPFPGWIFRNLSPTAKKLKICLSRDTTSNVIGEVPFRAYRALPPTNEPRRVLEEFDYALMPPSPSSVSIPRERMDRVIQVMSGLCFNFDFSRLKKLSFAAHDGDDSLWDLPRLCAATLVDLTFKSYPERTKGTFVVTPNHFTCFRSLRRLSLELDAGSLIPLERRRRPTFYEISAPQSLLDLFSVPLPPTLDQLVIRLAFTTSDETFSQLSVHYFVLSSWRRLDGILALQGGLQEVDVCVVLRHQDTEGGVDRGGFRGGETVARWMKECLPSLHGSGKGRFTSECHFN